MSREQSECVGNHMVEIDMQDASFRIPSTEETENVRRAPAMDHFQPKLQQQSWKVPTRAFTTRQGKNHKNDVHHYLKQGTLFKLTAHSDWICKKISLSETDLLITDAVGRTDYIPLHEICGTIISRFVDPHDTMQRASSDGPPESSRTPTNSLNKAWASRRVSTSKNGRSSSKDLSYVRLDSRIFDVQTVENGRHSGRTFTFRAESSQECLDWMAMLSSQSKKRIKVVQHQTFVHDWQAWARRTYAHPTCQSSVALLIFANFVLNAYQAEKDPQTMVSNDAEGGSTYALMDAILTSIFILELLFNAFGHWFWLFVQDPWNIFDFIIVLLSLVSLLVNSVPGLNVLRVLRAFRLLRLIKRFRSLRRIFNALILSIVPVINAFAICLVVTFIYTILGVFVFSEESPNGFGTFNRSLLSHFLLLAMQKWPDDIKLLSDEGDINVVAFLYLFSFVAIALWTCLQVVVAVLLDNFLTATFEEKKDEAIRKQLEHRRQGSPLDPLLEKLTNDFDTEEDLRRDIHAVFMILDEDDSNAISNEEMVIGFAKIEVTPRIHMSADDVQAMKQHSLGQREQDELSWLEFEMMIRIELRTYMQRMMHDAFIISNGDPSLLAMLGGLKLSLLDLPVGYIRSGPLTEEDEAVEGLQPTGSANSTAATRARVPVPWRPGEGNGVPSGEELLPAASRTSTRRRARVVREDESEARVRADGGGMELKREAPPVQDDREPPLRADGGCTELKSKLLEVERKVDALGAHVTRLHVALASGMAQLLNRLNQLDLKPAETLSPDLEPSVSTRITDSTWYK